MGYDDDVFEDAYAFQDERWEKGPNLNISAFGYGRLNPLCSMTEPSLLDYSDYTRCIAMYGGTLLLGSPISGYIADQCRSRKIPFICGLAALGTSTALFAFARTFPILVIARCLQGLSAAAVWVVGLAIVADDVPSDRVGAAMGKTTIGLTCRFIFGPMLGGLICDKFGYYAAFLLPTLLIVLDVALRFAMIEKSVHKPPTNLYDTLNPQEAGSTAHRSTCREDNTESAPLLRSLMAPNEEGNPQRQNITIFHLFLTPIFPIAMFATVCMALLFSALETVLPLFVMDTFGWTTGGAGLVLVALSVPNFAGVQIDMLVDSVGVRSLGTIGFVIGSCGWLLLRLVTNNSVGQVVLLVCLLLILGVSFVITEICAMTEVSQLIGDYESENPGAFGEKSPVTQAYAFFNMSFAGGQLLGPLIAGAIRVHAGWSNMTLVLGILTGLSAIPIAFFSGPPKRVTEEAENI
ncbi:hypothetical protein N7520_006971 [Penicillium odoratum]|uniref:uncharacterized protein n=1 Tax=Penicillium odoratum TaxID=1167516 RepID=UPI0025481590|nr:uncharacterized protein N7520_006971 [Penicillium odoratum]KAJ5759815.1 hypothetical protein N7520_006971 [Penicillium odoratum]